MSAICLSQLPVSNSWQEHFAAILPIVRTHAEIQFRKLPIQSREEAIQEAVASACVSYQRLDAKGSPCSATPATLATFAVKRVRSGRHVGGHQNSAHDVMSPVTSARHGVHVVSYHQKSTGIDAWQMVVVADRKESIPDTVAFRIDFARWLKEWNRRDRRIISALATGERTLAVAERFGLTPGRISQLRRKYAHDWRRFQGDTVAEDAA
jgi:hypothetical protein